MYGSYYREIRLLNPEIRSTSLPAGTHTIKVPLGWQKLAVTSQQGQTSSSPETVSAQHLKDGSIVYTVKSGDSLSKIAHKFNVSVNDITKIKGRSKSLSDIYPGEKLLILKR
jgi:LysM repeat protein